MIEPAETVALILAAGAASRFGGGKIRAVLDGRPLLAHVVAAVRDARIEHVLVVLGQDAAAVVAAMREHAPASWSGILRLLNPAPERGLSSSVRLGLAAATAIPGVRGVLIIPGDQPRVRPSVISALLAAPTPADTIAVAPRYAGDEAINPVLLLEAGWPLAARLDGDRGLGPLLAGQTARVVRVDVAGSNPDVDTRADLLELSR